mgnify:CR=1 FL=1
MTWLLVSLLGGLLVTAPRWLAALARRYLPNEVPIHPPQYRFTGVDELARQRTRVRRQIADDLRRQAEAVTGGSPGVQGPRRMGGDRA